MITQHYKKNIACKQQGDVSNNCFRFHVVNWLSKNLLKVISIETTKFLFKDCITNFLTKK